MPVRTTGGTGPVATTNPAPQETDETVGHETTEPVADKGPGPDDARHPSPDDALQPSPDEARHFNSPLLLTLFLLTAVMLQGPIRGALSAPVMQSWMTVFVAVMVQALPFLVLGVLLSAAIAVFVPPSFFARALPKRPALAVPVAGVAGAVLPGCECA
ncbi:permease, partial [Streptomyces afghaniensis]|uniref:permease n=1 Tax=Streptomyces afghaniensis TaxID=66865 RepID=UPI000560D5CD